MLIHTMSQIILSLLASIFPSVSAVNTYEAKQYYDKHFTEEYSRVWQMGEITLLWDEAKVVSGRKKRLPETIVVPVATECKVKTYLQGEDRANARTVAVSLVITKKNGGFNMVLRLMAHFRTSLQTRI